MITGQDFLSAILVLDELTGGEGGVVSWCRAREIDVGDFKEAAEFLAGELGEGVEPPDAVVAMAIGIEVERKRRDRETLPS